MRILGVKFTNFGPFYGEHTFDLDNRGLLLVMGDNCDEPRMDSNGSGKSSIFDALDWGLWGDNPRGDHAEAIVNEEAFSQRGAKCTVKIDLKTDDDRYVEITRTRTKSKTDLKVVVSGHEDLSTLDIKETQKEIENLLGLDREVFHNAVLFGQTDLVHYADSTDSKRMEILTKILQLDQIDVFLEKVKAKVKESVNRKVELETKLARLEGALQSIRPEELDAQIDRWDQDNRDQQDTLAQSLDALINERHVLLRCNRDIDSLRNRKQVIDKELMAVKPPIKSPELDQLEVEFFKVQAEIAVYSRDCNKLNTQLTSIQSQGEGICSLCHQRITAEHLQGEIARIQEYLLKTKNLEKESESKLQAIWSRMESIRAWDKSAVDSYQADRELKIKESSGIEGKIRSIEVEMTRLNRIDAGITAVHSRLESCKNELNPWIAQKISKENEKYELERQVGQIRYELDLVNQLTPYLDFWVKGFGAQGLKSYILDSRLQELSDAANEWLSFLTGGTIWVRFESQKQTRGKKLVNAPEVRVFRWNPNGTITERNYKSWSGGEKQRISFCIDFGLSRLVARRAKQKYDLLILDEVFKHLDRSGKEAVMEMLQALSREKTSLIVVEHDEEFKGHFDHRVLVTKKNGCSSIREFGNAQENKKVLSGDLQSNTHSKRKPVRRVPVRRPIAGN